MRCRPTSTGRLRLGQERGPRCVEAAGGLYVHRYLDTRRHDDDGGFGKFAHECRTTGGVADAKDGLVLKGGRGGYKRGERAKGSRGKVHVTTGRSFPIPCPALPCPALPPVQVMACHQCPWSFARCSSARLACPVLSICLPVVSTIQGSPRRGEGDGGPSLCAIIPPLGPPTPSLTTTTTAAPYHAPSLNMPFAASISYRSPTSSR